MHPVAAPRHVLISSTLHWPVSTNLDLSSPCMYLSAYAQRRCKRHRRIGRAAVTPRPFLPLAPITSPSLGPPRARLREAKKSPSSTASGRRWYPLERASSWRRRPPPLAVMKRLEPHRYLLLRLFSAVRPLPQTMVMNRHPPQPPRP